MKHKALKFAGLSVIAGSAILVKGAVAMQAASTAAVSLAGASAGAIIGAGTGYLAGVGTGIATGGTAIAASIPFAKIGGVMGAAVGGHAGTVASALGLGASAPAWAPAAVCVGGALVAGGVVAAAYQLGKMRSQSRAQDMTMTPSVIYLPA